MVGPAQDAALVAVVPVTAGFLGERLPSWQAEAACSGMPTDDFFPVGSTEPALEQIAAAKAICATCPVRAQCLDYALDTGQQYGIWGGLSEDELRAERRRQRRDRQ